MAYTDHDATNSRESWWELANIVRPTFFVALVIVFGLIGWLGYDVNGGLGRIKTWPSALVGSLDSGLVCFFAIGSIYLPSIRRIVMREASDIAPAKRALTRIAVVYGLVAILIPLSVVFHVP